MVAKVVVKPDRNADRYRSALQKRLKPGAKQKGDSGREFGATLLSDGLNPSKLARIHQETLIEALPGGDASVTGRNRTIERSFKFLADTISGTLTAHRKTVRSSAQLEQRFEKLEQDIGASKKELERERSKRRIAEKALKANEFDRTESKARSQKLQHQLRQLSHRFLLAQEQERKAISRELHDQIAQTLTGIKVHLAALRQIDAANSRDFGQSIMATQRLVTKAVDTVHRYARELRPTLLDDLGLIAALQSYLKDFEKRTSIMVRFTADPGVERLGDDKRTMLFRVSQEALTNVAQHAKTRSASLTISRIGSDICMEIQDDGKSFDVERVLFAKRHKRLGVLGMRERVEMLGGSFNIHSAPERGTTVRVQIPLCN